jgi:endoglucanase
MKKIPAFLLIFLFIFILSCEPAKEENSSGKQEDLAAYEYFEKHKVRAGINIGNTFDAWNRNTSTGVITSGEGIWRPAVTQEFFNNIKKAGFDIIRLPVTWMGHIGGAPDYTIEEAFMDRVAEVCGYAEKAGLKAIVNIHHDGSSSGSTDHGWLSVRRAAEDPAAKEQITDQFTKVWQQIAGRLKDYGLWLIFEPFNELHDGSWWWPGQAVNTSLFPMFEVINEWNQVFTDTVRASGGNNAKRYLMVPGYCSGPEAVTMAHYKLPADTIQGRQIVTFHYYKPDEVGLGTNSASTTKSNWGASQSDYTTIDNDLKPFFNYYTEGYVPVIIGECGATRQYYPDDPARTAQAHESRKKYLSHFFKTAKNYGIIPIYWDNGSSGNTANNITRETFGLFNRNSGKVDNPEFQEVIDAMIDAVK